MLGAIIGDIVGSRFEFNPTNDYNFELFGEGCSFTDDTICTIAVADAILRGRDYGESIHEWCRKYPDPKGGYGGRFRQWVMSDDPKPYGSFGNGSAMRVSPIAWWFDLQTGMYYEATKSASCTHNHPAGIDGANAVVSAISDCKRLRAEKMGRSINRQEILAFGLDHAIYEYRQDTQNFEVNIEDYRNKFDETCQGTIPVALAIILNSTGFEDAVRQAVSLGADADTLGAIVGSIAEALWGIPEWMKKKAMTYLPVEMQCVVREFHTRLNNRRRLSRMCKYYVVGDFTSVNEEHKPAYDIEREWVELLAKDDSIRKSINTFMREVMPLNRWQDVADEFGLPLTLVGKIFRIQCGKRGVSKAALKRFNKFMEAHYDYVSGDRREALEHKKQIKTMMLWKLGLGNMGLFLIGEDPMPSKEKVATADMMHDIHVISEEDKSVVTEWNFGYISPEKMEILKRGHIPEAQEDHWFMYYNEEDMTLHYCRSWTGHEVFVVYLSYCSRDFLVKKVEINKNLCEFGVNGDAAAMALLRYLLVAETSDNGMAAWDLYLDEWEAITKKYSKQNGK